MISSFVHIVKFYLVPVGDKAPKIHFPGMLLCEKMSSRVSMPLTLNPVMQSPRSEEAVTFVPPMCVCVCDTQYPFWHILVNPELPKTNPSEW